MGDIEFLILLLAAAAVLVRLADLISIPYPIVLVVGGLAIGLVPSLPDLELDPDVVFLVFLPPLLLAAGYYSSPRDLKAEVVPLASLAIGLVLATMVAVAVVAHAIVPGMSWEAAFVLGAIVGPTDPVAAIATLGRIGAPPRLRVIVEGEAMVNDGTALVAYRVALAAAVEGTFSAGHAAFEFLYTAAGGVAVGLAIGWLSMQVIRRQTDATLTIFFTVIMAYGSYVVAEEAHVSGVLSTVACGIYGGWVAPSTFDAGTRLSAGAFWAVLTFGLEALLFVLLGLQAPALAEQLDVQSLIVQAVVVSGVVIAIRLAWTMVPRPAFGESWRERLVVGWSGMRGAISLAAALSVPTSLPERPEILLLTFGVIFVTLLGQGLTLPLLLHKLDLPTANRWSPDEAMARLEAAQAALDRLDELEQQGADPEGLRRLRELYRRRFAACVAVLGGGELSDEGRQELRDYDMLRRDVIAAERAALLSLRNHGAVPAAVIRRVERDVDLDEARIGG